VFAAPLHCFPPGRCRQIAILPDEFLSDAQHTLNFARPCLTRQNRSMSNLIINPWHQVQQAWIKQELCSVERSTFKAWPNFII